jgi:mercuric ion binding protein
MLSFALLQFGTLVQAAGLETATLAVKGMTCPTCPLTVKVALKKQPGVSDVKVDLRRATARVVFDPEKVTVARLAKAVTDAGYPATPRR